ncbi:MAG: hypothetical protein ACM3VT_11160 [Solirubrobacterales bacterium]
MNGLWRRIAKALVVLMLAISAVAVMPGCREKGPAEKAGEKVDKAADETGKAVEKAGDAVQDAAK